MPVVKDYLDTQDPMQQAADAGTREVNYDLGLAPRPGVKVSRPKAVKPYDPFKDDPVYQDVLGRRKLAHGAESIAEARLKDFEQNEGKALKWQTTPGDYPGADPTAVARGEVQSNLLSSIRNAPGSPQNIQATRQMQLLAEKRQRLADDLERTKQARTKFDANVFLPLHQKAQSYGQPQEPVSQPEYDYMAPSEDSALGDRVASVNARRQRIGVAPIAPGSVSAGNFTERWVPLEERQQETDSEPNPLNDVNAPGDEDRGGTDSRDSVPDVLDEATRANDHRAMADDLKSKFSRSGPLDRLKMMFGGSGYGNTKTEDVSVPYGVPIGFGDAGTKGQLFTVPETQGNGIVSGLARAGNKFTSQLITPENAALMAATGGLGAVGALGAGSTLGTAASALKTAALGGFTAEMASGLPEQVKQAYKVYTDPKSSAADKAEALATPGLSAFMTALAGKGAVEEGRLAKRGGPVEPPDYNTSQDGRFTPQGPQQGGASPGTGTMLRKILLDAKAGNPDEIAKMSDLEAHEAVQKLAKQPIGAGLVQNADGSVTPEAVDIGARNPEISTGTGVETPAETQLMADWRKAIAEEQTNAPKIESPAEMDVRNPPGDGEAVGERNPVDQETPREGETQEVAPEGEGLSSGQDVISSEPSTLVENQTQNEPISRSLGEPSDSLVSESNRNESEQVGNGPAPERPVLPDERGLRVRSDRSGGSEQRSSSEGERTGLPSAPVEPPNDPSAGGSPSSPVSEGTGIKNESVEAQRKALGLPPSEPRSGLTNAEGLAQATEILAKNPLAGADLVKDLTENPRAATGVEDVVLTHELTRLDNERTAAEKQLDAARESGDVEAEKVAQQRVEEVRAEFEKAGAVADATGTQQSDALRLRQMMLKNDFSIANLERQQARANRGAPITPEQQARIKEQHNEFERTLKEVNDKLAVSEKARLSAETETEILRALHNSATETPKASPMGVNRLEQYFTEQGQAARARLLARHRQGQTNALFDPARAAQDLADVSLIGAEYLAKGISKGAAKLSDAKDWTEQMIKDFGEEVRPHLEAIFEGAKKAKGYMAKRANDPVLEPLRKQKTTLSNQLKKNDKNTNPNEYGYLRRRIDAVNRQIQAREKILASGDLESSGRKLTVNRPSPEELEIAQQKLAEVNKKISALKKGPEPTPEEKRLQARKNSLARNVARLKDKLAKGDFSPSETREQVKADQELLNAQAEHERLKGEVRRGQEHEELAKRTPLEKTIDYIPKLGRAFVLSYPSVFAKLAAAATARIAHSAVREGLISGLRQIPGVKGVAAKAPRFGSGWQTRAEVKAHTDGFVRALKGSVKYLKNQEPNESVLYGGEKPDPEWTSYLGRLHGALKTPALMSEFERSLYKRNLRDANKGLDVNDPAIKLQNSIDAYKDAKRSIFLQDNKLAGVVKSVTQYLRRPNKGQEKPNLAPRIAAAAVDFELPITKVPANILTEVLENIHGAGTGAIRVIANNLKGVDKLSPEAADEIMRQLSNGLIGNALILSGWLAYKNIGPTHQTNEKPRVKTLKDGSAKIGDTEIDKNLLHNPWYEAAQIGATAHHLVNPMDAKQPDDPNVSLAAAKSVLGLVEETPLARESMDVTKMLENPERAVPQHIAGRLIPGAIQQIASKGLPPLYDGDKNEIGDPTGRKPRNFTEDLEAAIPVLRKDVPQKSYVSPSIVKELNSVGLTVPDTDKPKIGPKKRPATEDEFQTYKQASETAISNRLASHLPSLKRMTPEAAKKAIEAIASQEHLKARIQLEIAARRQPVK